MARRDPLRHKVQRTRHAHAIPPELAAALDWYYDTLDDPSVASVLAGFGEQKCPFCEADVGEDHKVGCPYYGKVFVGGTARVEGTEPRVVMAARRQAAMGVALSRLPDGQRRALERAWTARKQAAVWRSLGTNARRGARLDEPQGCLTCPHWIGRHMTAREAQLEASYWVEQWQKRKRRPACKEAVQALEAERQRGAVW